MRLYTCLLENNDCYKAGRSIIPRGVMLHSTGANNPNLRRYVAPDDGLLGAPSSNNWNRGGLNVCVHAFVGKLADGSIASYQTLPWTMRGWHCGGSGNNTHISIELCEDALDDAAYFLAAYQEAVELTAYLCKKFSIDPMGRDAVLSHSEGHGRGIASNHADVGHWFVRFDKSMDDFRADVARHILCGDDKNAMSPCGDGHIVMSPCEGGELEMTQEQVKAIVREELAAIEAQRKQLPASEWAQPFIAKVVASKLMAEHGQSGIDRPRDYATREELATVASVILEKLQ